MAHILQAIINLFRPARESGKATIEALSDYTHLYRPSNNFNEEFYANLCKTINWTEHIISDIKDGSNINYATILRQTNPIYRGRPFYNFSFEGSPAPPGLPFDFDYVLKEALQVRNNIELRNRELNSIGKILTFLIDITTYDGAPVSCSEGFVDEADIPPIDTWFYITKKHLYCWIPTVFIPKMQDAIDVEIFGSYEWLQDANPDLNKQILQKAKQRLTGTL